MSTGIHAELALSCCGGCPVAALSASTPVEEVRVDSTDDRVEFVAADPPDDPPTELELVEFGGRAHGRYEIERGRSEADGGRSADDAADRRRMTDDAATDDAATDDAATDDAATDDAATDGGVPAGAPTAEGGPSPGVSPVAPSPTSSDGEICADCSCGGLPAAFANFPVSPRRTEVVDSEIRVSFVLSDTEELRAIVDECEMAGLDVELRRLCVDRGRSDGDECCPDVVAVDLAGVTDRQAEIATVAAERGYFGAGGASAEEVAAEFDLAKSTVSEQLRTVTEELFSQTFGDRL